MKAHSQNVWEEEMVFILREKWNLYMLVFISLQECGFTDIPNHACVSYLGFIFINCSKRVASAFAYA